MSEIIKIYEDKPSEAAIKKVVEVLKNGGLVIYPTDTVYGLGCDIFQPKAIEKIANSGSELQLYSVNNITSGTDAQGEVTVRLAKGGRIVNGQGADTDIVIASAKAYINGLNKLQSKLERAHPQV